MPVHPVRSTAALVLVALAACAVPREVSFPTADGGQVHADLWGRGERGVVLAGSAHAQLVFQGDQGRRLMDEIRRFLAQP